MSENLARIHGADPGKARIAGMLHDLARLYSTDRLVAECEERGIAIDAFARQNPVVLHAPLSARLAQDAFQVRDPEILSAIRKHTLADAEMGTLDCVVYLADALEPGREYDGRAETAELAKSDIRAAMRATIESSLRYLTQRRLALAPQTAAAMNTFGLQADALEDRTAGHS